MDFGIAKVTEKRRPNATQRGEVLGTPAYMAPEQALGNIDAISVATDIYALGIIAYEMLTGRLPFSADSDLMLLTMQIRDTPPPILDIAPDVPKALAELIDRCLSKEPHERPRSVKELSAKLVRAVESARALPATGALRRRTPRARVRQAAGRAAPRALRRPATHRSRTHRGAPRPSPGALAAVARQGRARRRRATRRARRGRRACRPDDDEDLIDEGSGATSRSPRTSLIAEDAIRRRGRRHGRAEASSPSHRRGPSTRRPRFLSEITDEPPGSGPVTAVARGWAGARQAAQAHATSRRLSVLSEQRLRDFAQGRRRPGFLRVSAQRIDPQRLCAHGQAAAHGQQPVRQPLRGQGVQRQAGGDHPRL